MGTLKFYKRNGIYAGMYNGVVINKRQLHPYESEKKYHLQQKQLKRLVQTNNLNFVIAGNEKFSWPEFRDISKPLYK